MKTKFLIIITFITILIIGCDSAERSCATTYFGGQIVNPKSDFVTLMKDDKVLKVIHLNADNTFITELDSITEGLYSFKHGSTNKGYEFQYIYFEPNDSILIHLNTWDFDESLVFTGIGAEKNNFLITLYLQNEKDEKYFSQYYNLNIEEFEQRIASIEATNMRVYEQLKKSGVILTPKFEEIAKVVVNYPNYRRKELYPFNHKNRLQLDAYPQLPNTYYDFRENTNLNNSDLISFFPYTNYVGNYIYSIAHREKENGINTNYTENVLNATIDNITIENLKNILLRQAIYNDFRQAKSSCTFNKTTLEIFNENCTNESYKNQIKNLTEDYERLKQNDPIDNFEVTTLTNYKTDIKTIIKDRKTVIYFWSPEMINSEMLVKRVKSLKQNHPSILFVGINMEPSENGSRANQFLDNQYLLTEDSHANSFLTSKEPRTILVDDNGVISNSFTYLSSQHIEKQLKKLEDN